MKFLRQGKMVPMRGRGKGGSGGAMALAPSTSSEKYSNLKKHRNFPNAAR